MRLEIARLAVVGNTGKHGAVIHMVTIEDGIVHGEICIAVGIHKDAAVGVGRTVKGMGQVTGCRSSRSPRYSGPAGRQSQPGSDRKRPQASVWAPALLQESG